MSDTGSDLDRWKTWRGCRRRPRARPNEWPLGLLNMHSGEDRGFFLRCYRNPLLRSLRSDDTEASSTRFARESVDPTEASYMPTDASVVENAGGRSPCTGRAI